MSSPFHKSKIVSERIYMKYTTGKIGKGCKTALFGVNSLRQEDTNVTPTFVYVGTFFNGMESVLLQQRSVSFKTILKF